MSDHQRIKGVIAKVSRRLRLQRFFEAFTTTAIVSLLAATIAVYLLRADLITLGGLLYALLGALLLPLLSGVVATARTLRTTAVAKLIDDSHGLHDRVGTAFEFTTAADPSPMMRAQVRQAVHHLSQIVPSKAAPFRAPRDLRAAALLSVCLLLVAALRFPTAPPPLPRPAAALPRLAVDREALAPHRDALTELMKDPSANDPELRALAKELNKLFDDLEHKRLTQKELFARLAELEKKLLKGLDLDYEDLLKKLKAMGKKLENDKLTKKLAEELKRADLKKAREELEKLAKKLERLKRRDRQRLAKTLKRAAQQKLDRKDLARQAQALQKQIRRLQRRLKKNPQQRRQLRRRLARKRRQLKRLNQRQQQHSQQRRQLQRLNRELQQAAADLINKLDPKQRKALEALMKAAQKLQRFANQIDKQRKMAKAQNNLQDLKEFLRRLGKGGKVRIGRLQDFMRRAGGQKGQGKGQQGKGKGKGKGKDIVLIPGMGGQGGVPLPMPGMGQGQQGSGQQGGMGADPGAGMGNGTDPNLKGDATKLAAKRKKIFVKGAEGKGPSRSEVILGAADKGFASRSYRRVYKDYTQIVEDVLKREQVPLGHRYYIKRYFELIKPR